MGASEQVERKLFQGEDRHYGKDEHLFIMERARGSNFTFQRGPKSKEDAILFIYRPSLEFEVDQKSR